MANMVPSIVRVGPYDMTLVLTDAMIEANGGRNWGTFEPNNHIISICVGQVPSPEFLTGVMWHELLHAMVYASSLTFNNGHVPTEEEVILHLEPALVGLFRDNPWLLEFTKKGVT